MRQLAEAAGATVVYEANTCAPNKQHVDVVLLDVATSQISDIIAITKLSTPVVAVDCLGRSALPLSELTHLGIVGYVPLARDPALLSSALNALSRGEQALYLDRTQAPEHEIDALDQQILRLLASGMIDREIGADVGLSHSAVKRRIAAIMRSHGLKSRFQLGLWFGLGKVTAAG
jgi:DNA-binding NarL/FixJ family response regulator